MKNQKVSPLYQFIKGTIRLFYPRIQVVGAENLPSEPAIFVGNHAQLHGPIACELYFPVERYTWCAGQMMELKEVPDYAFQDFWAQKPKSIRWLFRGLSYLIAPLSVCIFNHAQTIGVYHDSRILSTFKTTVKRLQEGASIVIFPECSQPHNHIVYQFQENFIDIAKLYHKRSGKALSFVPLYVAPQLRQLHIGKPIVFDPDAPIAQERARICRELMDAVTALAESLPLHTVIPYPNIPKKDYPTNIPSKEEFHETARR